MHTGEKQTYVNQYTFVTVQLNIKLLNSVIINIYFIFFLNVGLIKNHVYIESLYLIGY